MKYFLGWMMFALYHSVVLFFIPFWVQKDNDGISHSDGKDLGMWCFGNVVYFYAVCVVNVTMFVSSALWSWPLLIATFLGPLAWLFVAGIYQLLLWESNTEYYGTVTMVLSSPFFYVTMPFVFFATVFPLMLGQYYQRNYVADLSAILMEAYYKFPRLSENNTTQELVEWYLSGGMISLKHESRASMYRSPMKRLKTTIFRKPPLAE